MSVRTTRAGFIASWEAFDQRKFASVKDVANLQGGRLGHASSMNN